MPNPEVVYIQTDPSWRFSGNAAANDAALLSFEEWWDLWGDGPEPATTEHIEGWWDWHEAQADWRMCQRMGVGL